MLGAGAVIIDDDGLLLFPHSDLQIDGQRLEGIGVAPHVAIEPRASDTPDDVQIAAAVDEVITQIRQARTNG